VGLEHGDIACRVVGLRVQRRPQPGEAPADDAEVGLDDAGDRRLGLAGGQGREPERAHLGGRVRPAVGGGRLPAALAHAPAGRAAPAEARTTQPIAATSTSPSAWPSTRSPIIAAIAGSRLSRMLNVAALTIRRATSSSRYGIAEASAATASPTAITEP